VVVLEGSESPSIAPRGGGGSLNPSTRFYVGGAQDLVRIPHTPALERWSLAHVIECNHGTVLKFGLLHVSPG